MNQDFLILKLTETMKDLRIISPEYFWEIWHFLATINGVDEKL